MENFKLITSREVFIALIASTLSSIICGVIILDENGVKYYRTIDHIKLLALASSMAGAFFIMIRYLIERYIDKK